MSNAERDRHLLSLENLSPHMAKADLKKVEALRRAVGNAVERARRAIGWTQDQLAGEIATVLEREKFDTGQLAKWESGKERPQFDVLFAIEPIRWPLIESISQLDPTVEVVREIRKR